MWIAPLGMTTCSVHTRKADARLPGTGNSGTGNSKSRDARTVNLDITMITWIRTRRLSIKESLSVVYRAAVERMWRQ